VAQSTGISGRNTVEFRSLGWGHHANVSRFFGVLSCHSRPTSAGMLKNTVVTQLLVKDRNRFPPGLKHFILVYYSHNTCSGNDDACRSNSAAIILIDRVCKNRLFNQGFRLYAGLVWNGWWWVGSKALNLLWALH
jgi:hypothetical protein